MSHEHIDVPGDKTLRIPTTTPDSTVAYSWWSQRFASQDACLRAVADHRWSDGFNCPKCGHDQAWILQRHQIRHCQQCGFQASPTAGTMFENTRLPLPKWFDAIYLLFEKNGKLPAEQLRKKIGVTWRTARLMLLKLDRAIVSGELQDLLGPYLREVASQTDESNATVLADRGTPNERSAKIGRESTRTSDSDVRSDDRRNISVANEMKRNDPGDDENSGSQVPDQKIDSQTLESDAQGQPNIKSKSLLSNVRRFLFNKFRPVDR